MRTSTRLSFGPFHFDLSTHELRRDTVLLPLLPKDAAVLALLLRSSGSVVTKKAFFDDAWRGVTVGDDVLKTSIKRLRKVLADDFRTPQFIETVHRRGYRFIAPVHHQAHQTSTGDTAGGPALFGRGSELRFMRSVLERMESGETHLVAISGEAGIGKSALIEGFVHQCLDPEAVGHASGQCVAQSGQAEPYRPILEALGRKCRSAGKEDWIRILRQYGPMWLYQLPWLCEPAELEALKRSMAGASPTRMLRELAMVLEMASRERPLVLVIEDLHWADDATLDAINMMARCGQAARVLLCVTYRDPQVGSVSRVLGRTMDDLSHLGNCHPLALRPLSVEAVAALARHRFGGRPLPDALADWLLANSEGNPLFLHLLAEHAVERGWLQVDGPLRWQPQCDLHTNEAVPRSLKRLIELQLDRLQPEERLVAETASVCGMTFTARQMRAVLQEDELSLEHRCEKLAKQRLFFRRAGAVRWSDGRRSQKYRFVHALYQKHLYDQVPASRRQVSHQKIGEMLEAGFAGNYRHVIGALATHFEKGMAPVKASAYRLAAGEMAFERHAYEAVLVNVKRGIDLMETLPDEDVDLDIQVALHVNLAKALLTTRGYGAPGLLEAYERAYQLSRQRIAPAKILPILFGIYAYHHVRSDRERSLAICEDFHKLAAGASTSGYLVWEAFMRCSYYLYRGNFMEALRQAEHGLSIYDPERHEALARLFGVDAGLDCMGHRIWAYWFLGFPDRARLAADEALELARTHANPITLASVWAYKTWLNYFLNDVEQTFAEAEKLVSFCEEKGIFYWQNLGLAIQGWAMAQKGQWSAGAHRIRQSLEAHKATGSILGQAMLLTFLGDTLVMTRKCEEALAHLDEAIGLMAAADETWWLGGTLMVKAKVYQSMAPEAGRTEEKRRYEEMASECLYEALRVARSQRALSLELRIGVAIAEMMRQAGEEAALNDLLDPIVVRLTEGYDTQDWKTAQRLLGDHNRETMAPNPKGGKR